MQTLYITLIIILSLILVGLLIFYIITHRSNTNPDTLTKGGSYAFDAYEETNDVLKSLVDTILFYYQVDYIRNYRRKEPTLTNKHIIITDAHGSLDSIFIPLIEAGFIKEGNFGFDDNKFVFTLNDIKASTNKVVYCGDILGRGANRHNLHLLETVLDLSTEYHDNILFIIGNHEMSFFTDNSRTMYDAWFNETDYRNLVHNKLCEYILNHKDSIIYTFPTKNNTIMCSHTFINRGDVQYETYGMDAIDFENDDYTIDGIYEILKRLIAKNKVECVSDFLLQLVYNNRPSVDEDYGVEVNDRALYRPPGVTGKIEWFIGHTPAQKIEQEMRHIECKDNITIHMMDVNNANNCEDNEGASFRDLPGWDKNVSRAHECMYYAIVDNETGEISYSERIEANRAMEEMMKKLENESYKVEDVFEMSDNEDIFMNNIHKDEVKSWLSTYDAKQLTKKLRELGCNIWSYKMFEPMIIDYRKGIDNFDVIWRILNRGIHSKHGLSSYYGLIKGKIDGYKPPMEYDDDDFAYSEEYEAKVPPLIQKLRGYLVEIRGYEDDKDDELFPIDPVKDYKAKLIDKHVEASKLIDFVDKETVMKSEKPKEQAPKRIVTMYIPPKKKNKSEKLSQFSKTKTFYDPKNIYAFDE